MIRQVTSSLQTFKAVSFTQGLNVVVSEKSAGATDRQTRNSSGKSSLVDVISFLLGSDCGPDSLYRRDALVEHDFTMQLDVSGELVAVTRGGSRPTRIVVDAAFNDWHVEPKFDKKTGETYLNNNDWREVLGDRLFRIPPDTESYGPTFRSLINYFVRRERSGAFQDATKQSSQQQIWDTQVALSHLLDLDWRIPHDLQKVRLKEKALAVLKKQAKAGVLDKILGTSGELRTRLTVSEREARGLSEQLESFQVLPEYRDLEHEAGETAIELSRLANENTLDRERIESIQAQLKDEQAPSLPDIEQMYEEAEVVLPEIVIRRLAEVRQFNEVIVRNRTLHLQGEIDDATRRILDRDTRAAEIDVRRRTILETLDSHGALDQLNRLRDELSRKQAVVEEFRRKLEVARQVESQKTELTIERAQIQRRLAQDLDDRTETLEEAIVTFEDFSKRISDHEGSLFVTATDNGPLFDINVEGGESKGIRSMQVFCFDMMLSVLWARKKLGPGFLIHDSHLFDGMDSRQIGKALEIGAAESTANGFQYIVTLNSDVLAAAEFSERFDIEGHFNPTRLSDAHENGGLFGVRV